jgi:5-methylcytosine-specific restriction endonuclease McrA
MELKGNYPKTRRKRGSLLKEAGGDKKLASRLRHKTWVANNPERYRELVRKYNRKPSNRMASAKQAAKKRGYAWVLSRVEFEAIISNPCHYCEGAISVTGSGIDRLDNTKGYELSNCVPCCRECNRLKGDQYTPEETKAMVTLVKHMRAS